MSIRGIDTADDAFRPAVGLPRQNVPLFGAGAGPAYTHADGVAVPCVLGRTSTYARVDDAGGSCALRFTSAYARPDDVTASGVVRQTSAFSGHDDVIGCRAYAGSGDVRLTSFCSGSNDVISCRVYAGSCVARQTSALVSGSGVAVGCHVYVGSGDVRMTSRFSGTSDVIGCGVARLKSSRSAAWKLTRDVGGSVAAPAAASVPTLSVLPVDLGGLSMLLRCSKGALSSRSESVSV